MLLMWMFLHSDMIINDDTIIIIIFVVVVVLFHFSDNTHNILFFIIEDNNGQIIQRENFISFVIDNSFVTFHWFDNKLNAKNCNERETKRKNDEKKILFHWKMQKWIAAKWKKWWEIKRILPSIQNMNEWFVFGMIIWVVQ